MQAHHNEKIKELVHPPNIKLVNLFATLRQSNLSFEEKMVNY